jgi:hypothetical protein
VFVDIYLGYLGREYRECKEWRDLASDKLIGNNPDLILMSHYAGYSFIKNGTKSSATSEGWREGYRKLGEKLAFVDSKLLYLRDNPQFPMDVPNCLSRNVGGGGITESMCEVPINNVNIRKPLFNLAVSELQQLNGAYFLDLTSEYCPDDVCPTYRNGVVRYIDKHHLSYEFTKELSSIIEDNLLQALEKRVK